VLINTGITRICYEREYKLHTLEEMLKHTSVTLQRVDL
jgi:deoxycytidylate deaminase